MSNAFGVQWPKLGADELKQRGRKPSSDEIEPTLKPRDRDASGAALNLRPIETTVTSLPPLPELEPLPEMAELPKKAPTIAMGYAKRRQRVGPQQAEPSRVSREPMKSWDTGEDEPVGQAPQPLVAGMALRPNGRVRIDYSTERRTGARGYYIVGDAEAGLVVTGAQRVGANTWYVAPGLNVSIEGRRGRSGPEGYYIKEAVSRR